MTKETIVYRDFNLNFASNPLSGDIALLSNERSVAQAIKNLLLTDFGEIPFNSKIGSNIRALLFEPMSTVVAISLRDHVISCVNNFEPRIELQDVIIRDDIENNAYSVDISYNIVVSNNTYTASILLERLQ